MTVPETAVNRAGKTTDTWLLPPQVRMPSPPGAERRDSLISIEGVSVFYGAKQAIRHVSLDVPERSEITIELDRGPVGTWSDLCQIAVDAELRR